MLRKVVFTLMVAVLVSTVSVGSVSAAQEKVTVCHKPGTPAQATLEIAAPALNAHLDHGDYQGACHGSESAGCAALNAVAPDPQTDPNYYVFEVSDLDFLPGETIHVAITATAGAGAQSAVGVTDSNYNFLAIQFNYGFLEEQVTVSVDYVVVAGDDADGAGASVIGYFTLDAVHFSCTPAP